MIWWLQLMRLVVQPAVSVAADWTRDGVLWIPGLHLVIYAACWSVSALTGAVGVIRSGGAPRSLHLLGMVGYWMMWALASPRRLLMTLS